MTGDRVCSEEHESCTATTRLRDNPLGVPMQTSRLTQEELLPPPSREGNGLSSLMMRGRLHLLAAPASSADKKMQVTLCCTHKDRCTRRNGNRILWHHTPQWTRTVSVSLPPVPLPENSLVAVAHSPTCQKAIVFLPPSHLKQQHRQTHFTLPFADSPQTRLPPRSSAHRHAVRKRHALLPRMMEPHTPTRHPPTRRKQCLDTQNSFPQSTTAPSKQ
ncbi:hypothetical protein TcCL_Unassigned00086 [Trypanosoma cruzi]|nr:hypothetical protein TcCL_Unassigned00086 [Trypanosoma cruzi]